VPIDLENLWGRIVEACGTDNVAEIAAKAGITPQGIYKLRDGGKPTIDTLMALSDSTGVSVSWLLIGIPPSDLKKAENRAETAKFSASNSVSEDEGNFIPVYFEAGVEEIITRLAKENHLDVSEFVRELAVESLAARGEIATESQDRLNFIYYGEREERMVEVKLLGEIAAGKPILVFERQEEVLIPEEFIRPGRETFVLRVRGDSMIEEGILDGDLIICVQAAEVFNGETVVALIDGESATVKKFHRRGTQVRLEPANKEYKPLVLTTDRVTIQGVVVGIVRRK